MKKSVCIFIMLIITGLFVRQTEARPPRSSAPMYSRSPPFTQTEIDNAWIKVPWSHGGYYLHNTLTREDKPGPVYPDECDDF